MFSGLTLLLHITPQGASRGDDNRLEDSSRAVPARPPHHVPRAAAGPGTVQEIQGQGGALFYYFLFIKCSNYSNMLSELGRDLALHKKFRDKEVCFHLV